MSKRPNFILFITDQQRADNLGCYGHPVLQTPNIDGLAAQGVAYDRFYVASPVCMPSRSSLMTSRYPASHGVRANGIPLDRINVTFVEMLRSAGYDTALIGKSHLQPFTGEDALVGVPPTRGGYTPRAKGLEEAVRSDLKDPFYTMESPQSWAEGRPDIPLPFYGFDHVELATEHGDAVGGDYALWLRSQVPDAEALQGRANQLPHDYECPQAIRTAVPETLYSTSWVGMRAAEWIRNRQESERPFFLMVSFPDPHHPFNPPGKYWDMYRPEDMPEPVAFAPDADSAALPYVHAAKRSRAAGKANLHGMGTIACSKREALEARALTCGLITMIDDAIGNVLRELHDAGLDDTTVKCFTSDHGDNLGDHGLLFKGSEPYEGVTRVPFIWSDPDGKRGVRTESFGQLIDIGVSILERAKVEPPVGMQGAVLSCMGGPGRDEVLIQYDHQRANPQVGGTPRVHTLRKGHWRLSVYHEAEFNELYDLAADPGELNNLWDNPEHSSAQADMVLSLLKAEIAAVDRVPLPTQIA